MTLNDKNSVEKLINSVKRIDSNNNFEKTLHKINESKRIFEEENSKKEEPITRDSKDCDMCLRILPDSEPRRILCCLDQKQNRFSKTICKDCSIKDFHILSWCPECSMPIEQKKQAICVYVCETILEIHMTCSPVCRKSFEIEYELRSRELGRPGKNICYNNKYCTNTGQDYQHCSICKISTYCSKDCQKTDWENHKKMCKFMKK
jgi:hypothetical protein